MDTKDAGKLGGHARKRNLTKEQLTAIAMKGVAARKKKRKA
jgi:hypothetical protein